MLVVGANDVVNPSARDDTTSPIYGMPILDVDKAATVVVVKRSLSPGFAGIDNPLFYEDNTMMLFADGKAALESVVAALDRRLMEFSDVVRRRRMVRNYTDAPVDAAAVDRILDPARRGPSAGFSQGQSFVVVTDPERQAADRRAGQANRSMSPRASIRGSPRPRPCRGVRQRGAVPEPDTRAGQGSPRTSVREEDWPVPYWWVDAGACDDARAPGGGRRGSGGRLPRLPRHAGASAYSSAPG